MTVIDGYGLINPKKGLRKFITPSFKAMLISAAVVVMLAVFFDGEEVREIPMFATSLCGIVPAVMEAVFAAMTTSGIGSKSTKRLVLMRTSPDMEKNLGIMLLSDELRRSVMCMLTGGISAAIMLIFGFYERAYIFPGFIYGALAMYTVTTVGVFIIRAFSGIMAKFILVYIWYLIGGNVALIFYDMILRGETIAGVHIAAAALLAAVLGTLFHTYILRRARSCRYADKENREGT